MFGIRKRIVNFKKEIIEFIERNYITGFESRGKFISYSDLVQCKVCGCLLDKRTAFEGKSEIVEVEREKETRWGCIIVTNHLEKEIIKSIKENYYCKIHKPKEK